MPELQLPNRLTWLSADPAASTGWLRRVGFLVSPAGILELPPVEIRIVGSDGPGDRLVGADDVPDLPDMSRSTTPLTPQPNGVAGLVAVGWATVDAERTADEAREPFEHAPDDPHLGAFARRSTIAPLPIVVLEPNTEGRLAATLVRHGEGPVVLYVGAAEPGIERVVNAIRGSGGATSAILDGPLGPSILLAGGPPAGPHLIVVEPGTIRP